MWSPDSDAEIREVAQGWEKRIMARLRLHVYYMLCVHTDEVYCNPTQRPATRLTQRFHCETANFG